METTYWGMIGAGDVTEMKSGPAFQKVKGSQLIAVMRRDEEKLKDYAKRHRVDKWYTNAQQLIEDPEINAIYIATPPDTHEYYTLAALKAGKAVYVEKPMALNSGQAKKMLEAAADSGNQLTIAHYRREQPYFKKIKALINDNSIGMPRMASMRFWKKSLSQEELLDPKIQWRLDPAKSGGGLFHDLAPHQIDLMCYFFGEIECAHGISTSQALLYSADDIVSGQILFKNNVVFNGSWAFNVSEDSDICEILGSEGKLKFSIFSNQPIELINRQGKQSFSFDSLTHVQEPMISATVAYFQGKRENPCSALEGLKVMEIIDAFTSPINDKK